MFIHAGAGVTVKERDVVGIFDLDGSITTKDTADFLKSADRTGDAVSAGNDLPRSFILLSEKKNCSADNEYTVVFSHISSGKLSQRDIFGIVETT